MVENLRTGSPKKFCGLIQINLRTRIFQKFTDFAIADWAREFAVLEKNICAPTLAVYNTAQELPRYYLARFNTNLSHFLRDKANVITFPYLHRPTNVAFEDRIKNAFMIFSGFFCSFCIELSRSYYGTVPPRTFTEREKKKLPHVDDSDPKLLFRNPQHCL